MKLADVPPLLQQNRVIAIWGLFLLAVAISWVWSWYFVPNGLDDPLISYRYSDRLLHGKGLTWNDGEYVEGYSNLLWVLLVAAGGLVQPDLVRVGWVLGFLANAAVMAALVWTFGRNCSNSIIAVLGGLLVLSLSDSFAYWGAGGLETALFEALLAWALATTFRMHIGTLSWIGPGLILGLLAITRPDGILISVGITVAIILREGISRASIRTALGLVALPSFFFVAQVGFRLAYYGSPVPNTAYVKLGLGLERVWVGARYIGWAALDNCVPLVVALLAIVFLWRARRWQPLRAASVFVVPAILWLSYIDAIGGDAFPYYRLWMPAFVCIAFLVSSLLTALPAVRPSRHLILISISAFLYVALQESVDPWSVPIAHSPEIDRLEAFAKKAFPHDEEQPLRVGRRTIGDCLAVGQFLRNAFGAQQPLIAVNYAGCMPYASQLPSLDMLGLNDFHIARHRPPDMAPGIPGHELGDGVYVLSRKPDLIALCVPATGWAEPCFRGELEMVAKPDFPRYYRLVFFRTGTVEATLWTRIEDGRLGIVRTAESIHIPGFLLATRPGVRAILDHTGRMVAALESGDAVIENVYLPPGTWKVSLESEASAHLQLATSPAAASSVNLPGTLQIHSLGQAQSFRVFGGHGLVYGLEANRSIEAANN